MSMVFTQIFNGSELATFSTESTQSGHWLRHFPVSIHGQVALSATVCAVINVMGV
jgi:hypothetical protein